MTTPAPPFSPDRVREYYDRNTSAFVRHGQGKRVGAIHRAVWGPGVADRDQAFRYVEDQIAGSIGLDAHVLDLGCGVGASLSYLAQLKPIRGTGITISPVQARLGQERIAELGLAGRVTCLEGDYTAIPSSIGDVDLAYAIESFVHGPSPARFFSEAARVIKPGGLLIVCDDVRRESAAPRAKASLARFAAGWHVNSLVTAGEMRAMAAAAGFTHEATTDLTPYLELGRPRDRLFGALEGVLARVPFARMRLAPIVGGSALQTCLRCGWLAYDFAMFRRMA